MKKDRKGPPKIDVDNFLSDETESEGPMHELEVVGMEPPAARVDVEVEPDPQAGELEEMEQRHLRLRADFENYRKRVDREREEFGRQAAAALVLELLPVLDNLERAMDEALPEAGAFRHGLGLIHRQAMEVLQRAGLERIEAVGQPFDPQCHDAVERRDTDEHPHQTVLDELQAGYRFQGRLLRPSMVRVAYRAERQVAGPERED